MPAAPWVLRGINAVVAGLERVGLRRRIEVGEIVRAAQRETGLCDFGGDDWREPLDVLVRSALTEAGLTPFGRYYVHKELVQRLCNRLRIQHELTRDPGILEERVDRPVFILGLPRTGTTHLHRLLACDPDSRVPLTWEMSEPAPPPRAETYETDPRIAKLARTTRVINWASPALRAIHEVDARAPEECIALMANDLCSPWFTVPVHLPSYTKWYGEQDLTGSYQRHKVQLQLLQRYVRRQRWVLKAPTHLHGLEWLLSVYPDARIVWTYRDPAEVVPSAASLLFHFRFALCTSVDRVELGRELLDELASWVERGLEARARAEASTDSSAVFVDVDYADILRTPMQSVERIYDSLGLPLGDEARARMRAHLAKAVQHRHGVHRYTLEDYGLDRAMVASRFARHRGRSSASPASRQKA